MNEFQKKSYIVLASGENDEERNKFYKWTLIGTSILLKKEWKTLFKKIKFKGDYYFSSSKSLVFNIKKKIMNKEIYETG